MYDWIFMTNVVMTNIKTVIVRPTVLARCFC